MAVRQNRRNFECDEYARCSVSNLSSGCVFSFIRLSRAVVSTCDWSSAFRKCSLGWLDIGRDTLLFTFTKLAQQLKSFFFLGDCSVRFLHREPMLPADLMVSILLDTALISCLFGNSLLNYSGCLCLFPFFLILPALLNCIYFNFFLHYILSNNSCSSCLSVFNNFCTF